MILKIRILSLTGEIAVFQKHITNTHKDNELKHLPLTIQCGNTTLAHRHTPFSSFCTRNCLIVHACAFNRKLHCNQ